MPSPSSGPHSSPQTAKESEQIVQRVREVLEGFPDSDTFSKLRTNEELQALLENVKVRASKAIGLELPEEKVAHILSCGVTAACKLKDDASAYKLLELAEKTVGGNARYSIESILLQSALEVQDYARARTVIARIGKVFDAWQKELSSLDKVQKILKIQDDATREKDITKYQNNHRAQVNSFAWARSQIEALTVKLPKEREEVFAADTLAPTDRFVWQKAEPSLVPLEIKQVQEEFFELCKATLADSALVIYKGKVVDLHYAPWCEMRSCMMSTTKSIAATAAVMIAQRFGLDFEEVKVSDVMKGVDGWESWQTGAKKEITIQQVLNHTAALPGNRWFYNKQGHMNSSQQFRGEVDKNKGAREWELVYTKPDNKPSYEWDYSNPTAQLLDGTCTKLLQDNDPSFCAGREPRYIFRDFIHENIFKKLGMKSTEIQHYDGFSDVYGGMLSNALDMGRFALMVSNGGKLPGMKEEILPAETIARMTSTEKSEEAWKIFRYKNQWYPHGEGLPQGYSTQGAINNDIYVFKKLDLIFVRTQANGSELRAYNNGMRKIFTRLKEIESKLSAS